MSSSQLNNLQVNNLLTNNLVVNNHTVNQDIKNILHILKSGLYEGVVKYDNNIEKIERLFIVHDYGNSDIFLKYYIMGENTITTAEFIYKNNIIITNSQIFQENNMYFTRTAKIISTSNNSIKILYNGYKTNTRIFHENCNCDTNLIDNGFEVYVYDENNNLINKCIFTKIN